MTSADLHYSRKRLAWLVALGVLFVGLFLWVGLDAADFAERSGRRSIFARAIGPDALRVIAFGLAAACLALTLLYLRLLVGADRLAARADSGGVTLRTAFGSRTFRWSDVQELYLRRVRTPAGEQWIVMLKPRTGKDRGIAANALIERGEELEAWVEAAEWLRHAGSDRQGQL